MGPWGLDCSLENQEREPSPVALRTKHPASLNLSVRRLMNLCLFFLKRDEHVRFKQHRLCAGSGCSLLSIFRGRWTIVIAIKHNSSFPIPSLYIRNIYSASTNSVVRQAMWPDYAMNQSTPVKDILCISRTCCLTAFRLSPNCIG